VIIIIIIIITYKLVNKHFVASSMEELFRTADLHNILDFTKEIDFYSKL